MRNLDFSWLSTRMCQINNKVINPNASDVSPSDLLLMLDSKLCKISVSISPQSF
jgi:hypothetical protein